MSYNNIRHKLSHNGIVILDGPIGTECERRGIPMDPKSWCGSLTIDHYDKLKNIHKDYIVAGAQVITANTYASSRLSLEHAGIGDQFEQLNRSAIEVAKTAISDTGFKQILIAGAISHRIPVISGTATPDLSQAPDNQEMTEILTEQAMLLKDAGCDLIILEMMYDPKRMEPAFKAAQKTGLPVWAGFSARRRKDGKVLSFAPDREINFEDAIQILSEYDVEVAGIMHTPSDLVSDAIAIMRKGFKGSLMAYPDSGYFKMPFWQFQDIISPSDFLSFAQQWVKEGVKVIGGCCGLSPEHIETLRQLTSTE